MKSYKHLTKIERREISILKRRGYKPIEIARELGVNRSTISRELKRNKRKTGEYDAILAQNKAYTRRRYSKKTVRKLIKYPKMRKFVEESLLAYKWSPEQIAGRWNNETKNDTAVPILSAVTIYKYLESAEGWKYKQYLYSERKGGKKRRKKKIGKKELIPNRVNISERPESINQRKEKGDAEADLIVSSKEDLTALLTVIDRKSRLLHAEKLPNKRPSGVVKKMKKIQKHYSMNSVTLDNGVEFQQHEKYGCKTYFCNPYSSWEKGQIEYANRMIRRFIPKKSVIADFSDRKVQKIVTLINNTPRKCLNYKTPIEVHYDTVVHYISLNPNLLKI